MLPLVLANTCLCCNISSWPNKKFKTCGVCTRATYCSSECQQTNWNTHKIYCREYVNQLPGNNTNSKFFKINSADYLEFTKLYTQHIKLTYSIKSKSIDKTQGYPSGLMLYEIYNSINDIDNMYISMDKSICFDNKRVHYGNVGVYYDNNKFFSLACYYSSKHVILMCTLDNKATQFITHSMVVQKDKWISELINMMLNKNIIIPLDLIKVIKANIPNMMELKVLVGTDDTNYLLWFTEK